jgi:large subunit ribosomal protein L6
MGMSRVGKQPIQVPKGVEVHVGHGVVQVKGPKGSLLQPIPQGIQVTLEGNQVKVTRHSDEPKMRALHGTTRALLASAIAGVAVGFKRELDIVGVGYKAELKGPQELVFSLGYSHPVRFTLPEGIKASFDAKANRLTLEGVDKHLVGQVAATIRRLRPPDPYKGKGIKYAEEVLKLKAGKSGA